jgi:hypothetical protein
MFSAVLRYNALASVCINVQTGVLNAEANHKEGFMMIKKGVPFLCLAILLLLFGAGCAALLVGGAAGAGTVAYVAGELKSTENVSLDRAWKATQSAMKELEFAVTQKEKDALEAELTARGAGDKKVKVQLEKKADHVTEIRIRVGTFGDESLSIQILDKIKSRF